MLSLHMKLFYYITSLSICQVLFSSFFKSFRDVRYCLSYSNFYSISLLFKFVKYFFQVLSNFLFCDTFASACFFKCVSLSIISLSNKFVNTFSKVFFKLPSAFFPLVRTSSLNSRISLPRSTALLLYHYFLRLSRKKLCRYFSFFCLFCTKAILTKMAFDYFLIFLKLIFGLLFCFSA